MTDFLVYMPANELSKISDARYLPISQKIGMNKKTRLRAKPLTQDFDDDGVLQSATKKANFIVVAPRVYTT